MTKRNILAIFFLKNTRYLPTIIWERAFEIESQGSKKLKGHLSYESTFMHISYHIERRPIELGKADYKGLAFNFKISLFIAYVDLGSSVLILVLANGISDSIWWRINSP